MYSENPKVHTIENDMNDVLNLYRKVKKYFMNDDDTIYNLEMREHIRKHFFDENYENLNMETLNLLHSNESNCKRFNFIFMRYYHALCEIYMSLLYCFDYHNFITSMKLIREIIMDCRDIMNKMRISTKQKIDKSEIERLYYFQDKLTREISEAEEFIKNKNQLYYNAHNNS